MPDEVNVTARMEPDLHAFHVHAFHVHAFDLHTFDL
jgi:hypothetical protein